MTSLVLIDFEGSEIKQPSRSAIAAALKLGEVDVLVAGEGIDAAAQAAAKLPGVAKVHTRIRRVYAHALAEPLADLLVSLAPQYTASTGRLHRDRQERHAPSRRPAGRAGRSATFPP